MKKYLVLTLMMSLPISVSAQVKLVNGDESEESAACIAAVNDSSYDIDNSHGSTIMCNGLSLRKFALKYRERSQEAGESKVVVYQLNPSDNNVETQLCIAAANGEDELEALAKTTGYKTYKNISCNGESIMRFAKRYSK